MCFKNIYIYALGNTIFKIESTTTLKNLPMKQIHSP
jgi:hypothetical protein